MRQHLWVMQAREGFSCQSRVSPLSARQIGDEHQNFKVFSHSDNRSFSLGISPTSLALNQNVRASKLVQVLIRLQQCLFLEKVWCV